MQVKNASRCIRRCTISCARPIDAATMFLVHTLGHHGYYTMKLANSINWQRVLILSSLLFMKCCAADLSSGNDIEIPSHSYQLPSNRLSDLALYGLTVTVPRPTTELKPSTATETTRTPTSVSPPTTQTPDISTTQAPPEIHDKIQLSTLLLIVVAVVLCANLLCWLAYVCFRRACSRRANSSTGGSIVNDPPQSAPKSPAYLVLKYQPISVRRYSKDEVGQQPEPYYSKRSPSPKKVHFEADDRSRGKSKKIEETAKRLPKSGRTVSEGHLI